MCIAKLRQLEALLGGRKAGLAQMDCHVWRGRDGQERREAGRGETDSRNETEGEGYSGHRNKQG